LIYLAACYGHLGRITEGGKAIESANDIIAKRGKGGVLTLSQNLTGIVSTFLSAIDLDRFGGSAARERLRVGLSVIPELTWFGRMTVRGGPGSYSFEVKGATQIDFHTMKSLHERGAIFIDVSYTKSSIKEHIPGSVNFSDGLLVRFTREALIAFAQESDEVVVYCAGSGCEFTAFEAAQTANWGYDKVYFFIGDAVQAWKDAGYPVETKPVQ